MTESVDVIAQYNTAQDVYEQNFLSRMHACFAYACSGFLHSITCINKILGISRFRSLAF